MRNLTGRSMSNRAARSPRRWAFTLIELLIVIIIIAVVIAIVFPALRGARDASKKAATQAMFHDLGSASGQFIMDHRRSPGYFSPTEMADAGNADRGFTAMENIMLDLAGGMVAAPSATTISVGPIAGREVLVDPTQIGAQAGATRAYFVAPDKKMLVLQQNTAPQAENFKYTTVTDHARLPDVVDPFGQPILAWAEDRTVPVGTPFGRVSFDPAQPANRARFYWTGNAGLLRSSALGKMTTNQTFTANSVAHSLLGYGRSQAEIEASLEGVLGNPAFPDHVSPVPPVPRPAAARGSLVFHSAGADGYFVGSTDRGGKFAAGNAAPWLPWTVGYNNPVAAAGQQQQDPMERFDDILGKGDGSGG